MSGFYLMYRGWQDHPLFGAEPFSRRDAWVWIIEEAKFQDTEKGLGHCVVMQSRGQFSHSFRFMAKAWKWDEAKVRRFISRLKDEKMIDANVVGGQNLITVCNYNQYQPRSQASDADNDAATTQQRRDGDANKKKENKGKEGKESNSLRSFERTRGKISNEASATRWPDGQPIPDEWLVQAKEQFPELDAPICALRFVNHFSGKAGSAGTSMNWERTFINWMLEARDRAAKRRR